MEMRGKFSLVTAGIQDVSFKESETGGGWGVCPPSFGQDLCAQKPGKGIVIRTKDLTAAGRKAQVVVRTKSIWKTKTIPEIYPNNHLDPDPATAASPEGRRLWYSNRIQLDTVHFGEQALEGMGYRFIPRSGDKLCPALSVISDPTFSWFVDLRLTLPHKGKKENGSNNIANKA